MNSIRVVARAPGNELAICSSDSSAGWGWAICPPPRLSSFLFPLFFVFLLSFENVTGCLLVLQLLPNYDFFFLNIDYSIKMDRVGGGLNVLIYRLSVLGCCAVADT